MLEQMRDIAFVAGEEIIDAQHLMPIADQAIAEMRAEEAGPAGDQDAFSVGIITDHGSA
jgi:hypothetical protein